MDLYTFHFGLRIRVVRAVPDLRADPVSPTLKHASRTFEDVFCMPMPVSKTLASGLSDLFFAGDCVWSDVHFGFKLLGFDFFDFNYVLGT